MAVDFAESSLRSGRQSSKDDFADTSRLMCIAYEVPTAVLILESWLKIADEGEQLDLDELPSEAMDRPRSTGKPPPVGRAKPAESIARKSVMLPRLRDRILGEQERELRRYVWKLNALIPDEEPWNFWRGEGRM